MSALADENKQRIAGFMVDLATVLGFNGALGEAEDQDHRSADFSATRSRARSAAPITPAFSPMLAQQFWDAIHADYDSNPSAFLTTGRPMWTPTAPDPSAEAIILT